MVAELKIYTNRSDDKDDHLLIRCVFFIMEIWKDVLDHEGLYQVSNFGNIRSLDRIAYHPINGNMKLKGLIKKQSTDQDGYKLTGFSINGKCTTFKVHRLVALHFIPNPENKPEVNHKDGNKQNNNDWNLEWNTKLENIQHSILTGLANRNGEGNGRSLLTDIQVLEIRNIKNKTMAQIARDYNVSFDAISKITKRKTWKHI